MEQNSQTFIVHLTREETEQKQRQEQNIAEAERLKQKVATLITELLQAELAIANHHQIAEKITVDASTAAGKELAQAGEIEKRLPRLRQRLSEAEREYGDAALKLPKPNKSHLFTPSILGLGR